ncbi:MAG: protein kinase domain-containing protein [Bryobacteraceae bacterium]
MTPERYQRIADVFHGAAELDNERRERFLAVACDRDSELLREVESLLSAGEQSPTFLASAPGGTIAPDLRIPAGRRIGHYVVDSFMGAGGMGQVYLATDSRLGRKVALKLLPPGVGESGPRVARFEAEARAASALNHPNIVTVYDVGVAEEGRFIVMEHIAGRTLRDMLTCGPILDAMPRLGSQMARALRTAHAGGITHRDIKPENIMVRDDGFVKVLDFGLARLVYSDRPGNDSAPGFRMGTVRYMSPEQARGSKAESPSDIFSLGIVFYEMATGRHPFPADSTLGTLHAIIAGGPAPPSIANPSIRPGLERLILAMLEKDPAKRPTGAELETALESQSGAGMGTSRGRHNLPAQRTSFLGRERELAAIEPLLRNHALRLLTFTGTGGTGKTRLALRAAENALPAFPGGVYFADLTALAQTGLVMPAIAKALGVRETAEQDLPAAIAHHLDGPDPTLLVLDNFEHLLDAGPRIADLLQRCPALKTLVTSRVALRLYGEQEFPVPPLPLPAEGAGPQVENMEEFASIALFVQRASSILPGFHLTSGNAAAVAEICRRLDGLPLAIELAASRVKTLPPGSLLARIENRLEFLTGGGRDLPERQQTLRRTIDWSYDLLTDAERRLFARLSVFVGGCTLEAAEAVCNTREDLGVEVTEGVSSLVDKSLLLQSAGEAEEPRFSMLETIRDYARERLEASGERAETERAHAAFFLVLSEEIGALDPLGRQASLGSYEREYGNVRAAIRRLAASDDAEWALRLGGAQIWYWEQVEYFSEGRELLETILRMPAAQQPTALRARVAYTLATLCYRLGDYGSARRLHEEEALRIFRQIGDRRGMASALVGLGVIKHCLRRFEEAKGHLQSAVQMWRELGDDEAADYSLHNLARIAEAQKDFVTARAILETLAVNLRARGDVRGTAFALTSLGDVAAGQGHLGQAKEYHEDGLRLFRELGDAAGMAPVLADLGNLARDAGDYAAAEERYRESLRKAVEAARRTHIARALIGMATCALLQCRHERALMLAGSASAILKSVVASGLSDYRGTAQNILEQSRLQLDPADHARILAQSRCFTLDQTLEYALASH